MSLGLTILIGLYQLQVGRCAYCGCQMDQPRPHKQQHAGPRTPTIDHMVPLCEGGRDTAENRVAACNQCNQDKGGLHVRAFLQLRFNPMMLAAARNAVQRHRHRTDDRSRMNGG